MLKKSSISSPVIGDTPETDSLLNPTYHNVQIKLVEIVNPNTTTVKFKDHVYCNDYPDSNFTHLNVPATSEESISDFASAATAMSKDDHYHQDSRMNIKRIDNSAAESHSHNEQGGVSIHVANIPLDPHNLTSPQYNKISREEEYISHSRLLKQRRKDELVLQKRQLLDSFRQTNRRSSAKHHSSPQVSRYYEVAPGIIVAERPTSRVAPNTSPCNNVQSNRLTYNGSCDNRAVTVPHGKKSRVWTGRRSSSSRAVSSISSQWKKEEPVISKPNMFIKMPFKQVPFVTLDSNFEVQDETILPGEELRTTTAFALTRIRQALHRMPPPSHEGFRQGRLLKAKLRPLRPVNKGPRISTCRGVQPEIRPHSASQNITQQRQLKQKYIEVCKRYKQNTLEGEYKRRANAHSASSDQSIHRTSPQPEDDPDYQHGIYPVILENDFEHIDPDVRTHYKQQEESSESLEHKFDSMNMDSNCIY